ncbi:MAG TPA: hypothetical protein VMW91_10945 [Desulfosporosinus sp.]|nr:hypothetical protein [Desulfosporosinus sp.]
MADVQEVEFEKLKKDELVAMAKELEGKVQALSEGNGQTVAGLINVGSLWGTDPQGNKYYNKNQERMYIGTISFRVMLSMNRFKQGGSRQPDLRLVAMPFRPAPGGDGQDVFDELEGQDTENPLL